MGFPGKSDRRLLGFEGMLFHEAEASLMASMLVV